MTAEVLSHGDDEPRRGGPGRALGAVVALVLLAIVGTAVARSRSAPAARPSPPPSPSAQPTPPPLEVVDPVVDPAFEPFAEFVTVRRPPPGVVRTVLLADGLPGFLMPGEGDDLPSALAAAGGPPHAPVLVGWCAATELFQDAAGTMFFDRAGTALTGGESLPVHGVRRNGRDPGRLDVDAMGGWPVGRVATGRARPPRCPSRLYLPDLPPRGTRVHDTVNGFRVLRGRYIVSTHSRAFCEAHALPGCASRGWEEYGAGALPPDDLAGSYTWEGDFVVRGEAEGGLRVVALPGVRLIRRERVGVAARHGTALRVDGRQGAATVRFDPIGPAGPRGYRFRPDAEIHLGPGTTGLGRPAATPETLRDWLVTPENAGRQLYLILDARGRILRLVAA